ncbi:MAG: ABC transporter substrate-binding protein [Clostridia bacterium]|nr:ABC transporter substrate-binding protein [Clostridia bacterium]
MKTFKTVNIFETVKASETAKTSETVKTFRSVKAFRKVAALLFAAMMLAAVMASAGCSVKDGPGAKSGEKLENVRVFALKGPTGLGMVGLMDKGEKGETANSYKVTLASSPDEVTAEVIAGRFEIAAVPANLAAVLYNKTEGKVLLAAVNTLGVLYVLENGDTIREIADLKGKTIGATGQGSTPQYVLEYILRANGLEPGKDVTVEYYSEHAELAARMASGDVAVGMLPEPNVTSVLVKNADVRIAVDLTKEWEKSDKSGSTLTQGTVIVSRSFAEAHPDQLNDFLREYGESAAFVNANVSEAAELAEKFGVVPSKAIAAKAIPNCNIVTFTGNDAKARLSGFLKVLFEADAKSVGGQLPGDDFYYMGYAG